MGGALRKTMVYLGLAEEEERYYADDGDDEDLIEDPADDYRGERTSDRHVDLRDAEAESERRAQVTPITRGHVDASCPRRCRNLSSTGSPPSIPVRTTRRRPSGRRSARERR